MANYGHGNASHCKKHLWGVIVIGILTVFLVASFCHLFKKKILPALKRKTQLPPMKRKGTLKDEKNMLRRFELEEVVKATKNFSQECLLGSGAFGNVYKGTFDVDGTLAIKRPHNESCQSAEEFMNGAKGSKILVYEYVPNGSLLEYITGIAHLHGGIKPSIIHRDIKPSNILVGDGFEGKVSDFGPVKCGPTGDQSHVSSQVKGTPGYLDPPIVQAST